ncbi:hypothetical protein D9M71_622750 [compost metagenome]
MLRYKKMHKGLLFLLIKADIWNTLNICMIYCVKKEHHILKFMAVVEELFYLVKLKSFIRMALQGYSHQRMAVF